MSSLVRRWAPGSGQALGRATRRALLGGTIIPALPVTLAACGLPRGERPVPADAPAVTLRLYYRVPSDIVRQSYDQLIAEWPKHHPRITLDPEAADSSTFVPRLRAQMAAGTPPDAAPCDWNEIADWVYEGLLLPIDDLMKTARVSPDEWFAGPMDYGHILGKHHGLPITGYSTVVYYNRTLFQQHGVPPPPTDGSWRWRDLEALAVRFTRREPGSPQTSQWGLQPTLNLANVIGTAVRQNGGDVVDRREAPTKTTLGDAPAVAAMQWLVDLTRRHRVVPEAEEARELGRDPFVAGKVAMVWGPMSLFFNSMLTITDFAWDLVPGPRGPDGRQAATTQTNLFGAFKATKAPDAAFTLIHYLTAGPGVRIRAQVQQVAVAHKRTLQEVWLKAPPVVNRKALVDSHPYTRDLFKGRMVNRWITETQRPLVAAVNGQSDVRAAVDEAVRQGNTVLAEANAGR
jgi:multiple sugar transport system substrate-binding protein